MIEAQSLSRNPEIRHGFFTREGGYSAGLYASLNCGYGSKDKKSAIGRNRRHIATSLGLAPEKLLNVHQIHSAQAVTVIEPWTSNNAPRADGMATARWGMALGVLSADCAPVLFADCENGVIGAAHAGWRGALGGITDAVLDAMIELGAAPHSIQAAIGPAISQSSYEVGVDLYDAVIAQDAGNQVFFSAAERTGHHMFDLAGYVAGRLNSRELKSVEILPLCTYLDEKRFFSYRRATHRDEKDYGRQISAITLGPEGFF